MCENQSSGEIGAFLGCLVADDSAADFPISTDPKFDGVYFIVYLHVDFEECVQNKKVLWRYIP